MIASAGDRRTLNVDADAVIGSAADERRSDYESWGSPLFRRWCFAGAGRRLADGADGLGNRAMR
jgi:hypothetical protein